MTSLYTAVIKPEFGTYRINLPHFYKVLGVTSDSYGKVVIVYLTDPASEDKNVTFFIMNIADTIPPKLKYLGSVSPNQGQLFHVFVQQA